MQNPELPTADPIARGKIWSRSFALLIGLFLLFAPNVCDAQTQRDFVQLFVMRNQTDSRFFDQLTAKVQNKIADMDRICELTDEQAERLRQAAQLDIQRLRYDCTTARALTLNGDLNNGVQMQNAMKLLQPLITKVITSNLFGSESLFAKTIHDTLSDAQRSACRKEVCLRFVRARRAFSLYTVSQMDSMASFSQVEREKLVELLNQPDTSELLDSNVTMPTQVLFRPLPADTLSNFLTEKQITIVNDNLSRLEAFGWSEF